MAPTMIRGLREPLLHFAILGAAIFVVDVTLAPAPDAGRRIEVTPAVREELAGRFHQAEGRAPSGAELDHMIGAWVSEEVLYRQGRVLGLDEGDAIIRDRVVQRMTVLLRNSVVVEPPEEAELHRWFETHRARFDMPARFDFVAKQVSGGEQEARALAEALRRALETGEGPLLPEEPIARFAERPRPNVVALFGEDFASALESLPAFEWQALAAPQGWQVVRLDGLWPAQVAQFDAVREAVAVDWARAAETEKATTALREMTDGYRIVRPEPAGPDARVAASRGGEG
jgi:hypothetical protein